MTTEQNPSGSPTETSGQSQENLTNNNTSAELKSIEALKAKNSELLGEKKKLQAEFEALKAEMQKIKEEKLAADGKKDDLITEYKKRNEEIENKFRDSVSKFAMKILTDAVEKEAIKAGCLNPKLMTKLVDLSEIEVNDDFEVDGEALKKSIEKVKSENPFLFSKQAPQFKDVTKPNVTIDKKGLQGKSVSELAEMLAKMN